jgi:hypothetical protein
MSIKVASFGAAAQGILFPGAIRIGAAAASPRHQANAATPFA